MGGNAPRQKCPSFSSSQQGGGMNSGSDKFNNPYYQNATNEVQTVLAPPVLAKNRYGREDLLALFTTPTEPSAKNHEPPERLGLDFTDFFIEEARTPICMLPFSDMEQVCNYTYNIRYIL